MGTCRLLWLVAPLAQGIKVKNRRNCIVHSQQRKKKRRENGGAHPRGADRGCRYEIVGASASAWLIIWRTIRPLARGPAGRAGELVGPS